MFDTKQLKIPQIHNAIIRYKYSANCSPWILIEYGSDIRRAIFINTTVNITKQSL